MTIVISDDVGDEFADGLGVTLAGRALAFGRARTIFAVRRNWSRLAGFAASIADAKGNPRSETFERGGTSALGGTGASVLSHKRTPHQCPHGSAV